MARTLMSVFAPPLRETEPQAPPAAAAVAGEPVADSTADRKPVTAARPGIKLGKTLVFTGDLAVGEEVLLLGTVEGSFECTDSLTIGAGGRVVGDIRARVIIIKGTVQGNIRASESVTINPGAVVTGEVESPRVTIVEGAQFNGSVKMAKVADESAKDAPVAADQGGMPLSGAAVEQLLGLLNQRLKS